MKNKLLYIIIAIIVVIGLIMGVTKGFNMGLAFSSHEKVLIFLDQTIETADIKDIANKAFENEFTRIQTVELFKDSVSITVKSATDEQIDKLIQLINEKYNLEYTKDDITIIEVPATTIKDIIDNYTIPVICIIITSALYIAIRYWRLGFWKTFLYAICVIVVSEAILASAYTIIQIPVNELLMPLALLLLGGTIILLQLCLSKKADELKRHEEDEEIEYEKN